MTNVRSLSFLIPAYNDNATIRTVIREARAVGKRIARRVEIIVVDDGSQEPIALRGVRIIRHATNQGYGRTIKELYYTGKYDWLFTIPGDYQVGAKEVEKLIAYTLHADMILGRRLPRYDPPNRLFVSWVYNTLLRVLFGFALHDVNSVRLMRRSVIDDIHLTSSSAFVDAELVIRAKRAGYRVAEAPIEHRARQDARQGRGNQWRTIIETIRDMVRFPYEENR